MPAFHALLLTDVVDSTRLTEELGDAAMAQLWIAHDRVARDLLPLWRGREIDKTDGMLLLFDDVRDAIGYALAYHRALAARELPFKARAGIHVGPVSLRQNPPDDVARGAKPVEVDGLALPIAARVMSVALGAQTLLSADARLALGVASQRVVSHGHWRMHGVADPIELFEIGDIGEGSCAPFTAPPDSAKVYRVMRQGDLWQPVREVRHSVPAERDSFVGRQEPLLQLAKKFDDGARLVSMLGIGGTGKTRLATRFAWTWLGDYPGGVWFCDLSQARGVDGILFAVAQGLDVPLGKTDPVVQLAHAIAGRGRCLVILDNFEQVARHAEETLGRWLDRAPLAQFLVTTREVLGIVGEETLALAPLPRADAAVLFQRRAESARAGYTPNADDLSAIEQLVKVLDGLPLAIELAAARVRVMPPRTLLARMSDRFKVLWSSSGRRDRQATLRAAFDWSWELLSEAEKVALAQLSVFEGGFTFESAEAVLALDSVAAEPPWAGDVVQWLVDKSFVRQGADDRFDLLESVREYAAEHLHTEGRYAGSGPQAAAAAKERHGAFFARFGPVRAIERHCADLDNLIAACRRAVARGDGETATQALEGAWGALGLRGPFRVAIDMAALVGAMPHLTAKASVVLDCVGGQTALSIGRMAEARIRLESAVTGATQPGDRGYLARSLVALADLNVHEARIEEARLCYRRALEIAQTLGSHTSRFFALNGLGICHAYLGETSDARRLFEQALVAAREAGNLRLEGGALGNLGELLANQGLRREAHGLYEQALLIARQTGDRRWEGNVGCNLGLLHHAESRMDEAHAELAAALQIARELGYTRLEAVVRCNLGIVQLARGQAKAAGEHYEAALHIARELGDRRSEGQFLGYLGVLHARQGRLVESRECLRVGSALLRAMLDQVSLGVLLCGTVELERLAGNPTAAAEALNEAEALAQRCGVSADSEFGNSLARVRDLATG